MRYLKAKYLPPRLPVGFAILGWLLLDRLGACGWAYGVLWSVVALLVVAFFVELVKGEAVDLPPPGR